MPNTVGTVPAAHAEPDAGVRDTARVAVLAALIVALTLVPGLYLFGGAVPVTLQTLAVTLAGVLVGARRGLYAVLTYLAMVVVGLPVASGFRGGLGVLAGPTGGFLVGFVPMVVVVGLLAGLAVRRLRGVALTLGLFGAGLVGIPALYAVGVPWLSVVAGVSLAEAGLMMAPFLVGDVLKAGVAAVVSAAVVRALPGLVGPRR